MYIFMLLQVCHIINIIEDFMFQYCICCCCCCCWVTHSWRFLIAMLDSFSCSRCLIFKLIVETHLKWNYLHFKLFENFKPNFIYFIWFGRRLWCVKAVVPTHHLPSFLPQPFHLYEGFKGGVGKVMEWQSNGL